MKFVNLTIAICFCVCVCFVNEALSQPETSNFYEIQKRANQHFFLKEKSAKVSSENEEREFDGSYHHYKRWEWYWQDRVMPDGSFPDLRKQHEVYLQNNMQLKSASENETPIWTCINQKTCTGGYHGMGRATSIAFHPTNPETFYVGAPIGGIWKTTNGGKTYEAKGDELPYVGVGCILVDHQHPDTIYISISDNDGWWNYSLGVYKSLDGGNTWKESGLNWDFTFKGAIYRMEMSPDDPNVILLASTKGIYKTSNGGETWQVKMSGSWNDIKFRPGDSQTLYATKDDYWGTSQVYRSDNGGETWTKKSNFTFDKNAIKLAVTPANPDMVAIINTANKKVYVSKNKGDTFTFKSDGEASGVIFVSPFNEDILYHGFVDPFQSKDGGKTWNKISLWYGGESLPVVHADQRFVRYNPLNEKIYFCNDGGIYSYDEKGNNWEELTDGLIITQYYRMATAQTDPIMMIGGTQDNGGRKRNSDGSWTATNGGDAMEVAIDPTNHDIFYTTYINGELFRTTDGWKTSSKISSNIPGEPKGEWVTPYVLDPVNPNTIVAGYNKVYYSTNRGNNWTAISGYLAGGSDQNLQCIAVAPSNTKVIYASRSRSLYVTKDLGSTWTTHNVPFSENRIASIIVHPKDSATIWVSATGYSYNEKVYKSTDAGASWENISGNLPNVPVSALAIDTTQTNNAIYAGTDAGVYFKNDTIDDWMYFGKGLPNTSVTDIEFQYQAEKVRIATYGRGIWETNMFGREISVNPEVTILLPASNTQIGNGESIEISAEASDADGEIEKVVFFNKSMKIAELSEPPYSLTLNSIQAGEYAMIVRAIDNQGNIGESNVVNFTVSCPNDGKLSGSVIGTDGSWNNSGNTKYKVFDGNTTTYFDAPSGYGAWAGLDMGQNKLIQGIRFFPRSGQNARMNGGMFQACNYADFSQDVVTFYTINGSPKSEWNCININNETEYRYVRYLSPDNGFGNISEMEVYSGIKTSIFNPTNNGEIKVYPNPFEDELTIKNIPQEVKLTLSSVTGMSVPFRQTKTSDGFKINIDRNHSPGIYCLSVQEGRNVTLVKLLKQ